MKNLILAALALAAGCVSSQELTLCGTTEAPADLDFEVEEEDDLEARAKLKYDINAYIHVVTTEAKKDLYPMSMVEEQMRVINQAYAPSRITFTTKSIDFIVNDKWATAVRGPVEVEFKAGLRTGNYDDLNLYFLSNLGGGLAGFGTYPEKIVTDAVHVLDGAVLLAGVMTGGVIPGFELGYTAVHEVGHWLGLYHPFQDENCTAKGDRVIDTPAQLTATSGCPVGKDSCPEQEGLDAIHNYMDYSSDECKTGFTNMQGHRMRKVFGDFRLGKK